MGKDSKLKEVSLAVIDDIKLTDKQRRWTAVLNEIKGVAGQNMPVTIKLKDGTRVGGMAPEIVIANGFVKIYQVSADALLIIDMDDIAMMGINSTIGL